VPAKPYSLAEDARATLVRVLAYMGSLAILAIAAFCFLQPPPGTAATGHSLRAKWVSVERPHPAFELMMPELAASDTGYAIERRVSDGARKDKLTWGTASGRGPFVMIEVYRPAVASDRFIDAQSEIAARLLDFTVTDDVKAVGAIDSKFGDVPLVDFAIAPQSRERRCLGFAKPFETPAMQIAGWYCSAGQEIVERATLACALDRLTIVSAGGDAKLNALFARAEVKRNFCGRRNPILAATPEREERIITPQNAQLRGRLPAR
jgi:hypothetical protein